MGNLYRYSAISTKLRAMRRQLIPDSAFRELAHCGTVPDIIRSLEEYPQYQEIFLSVDPETLHRDELERLDVYKRQLSRCTELAAQKASSSQLKA